jgi:hypothetical protein
MSDRIRTHSRSEIFLAVFFGLVLCSLLIEQSLSLYTAPRPDAVRWYGDETWQMRQFQTQMREGILRNPDAPGSSIFHNNGILPNSLWIDAALYGTPELLFFPTFSPVAIGRSVTLFIALTLLAYAYWMQRKRGVAPWMAICVCILLVASRAFFFASHSARYDLFIAFGALLSIDFLSHIFRSIQNGRPIARGEKILLAAFPALCLAWNIHLTRIELLPYLTLLIVIVVKNYRKALSLLAANAVVIILLLIPAIILVSPWSLFNAGTGHSMLGETFGNNPVLRIFSPSILRSAMMERFSGLQAEAPIAFDCSLVFIIFGIISLFFRNRDAKQSEFSVLLFLALSFFSWALTLRYVPYYSIHLLPAIVICSSIIVWNGYKKIGNNIARRFISVLFATIILFAVYESFEDAVIASSRGEIIAISTQKAVSVATSLMQTKGDIRVPTVLVGLQLQDNVLPIKGIHAINSLYREYPDSIITLAQFLKSKHVDYILDAPSAQVFAELAVGMPVDSLLKSSPKFFGHFSDWKFDYFQNDPLREDTLVLYALPTRVTKPSQ